MIKVFSSHERNFMDYQYTCIHCLQIRVHTYTKRKKYEAQRMFIWVFLSLIKEDGVSFLKMNQHDLYY